MHAGTCAPSMVDSPQAGLHTKSSPACSAAPPAGKSAPGPTHPNPIPAQVLLVGYAAMIAADLTFALVPTVYGELAPRLDRKDKAACMTCTRVHPCLVRR